VGGAAGFELVEIAGVAQAAEDDPAFRSVMQTVGDPARGRIAPWNQELWLDNHFPA
jgi:hypothetical protein